MRKLIFLIIFTLFLTARAFSHPPSDIKIKIDGVYITVDIMHAVADPTKHYIYEVKVDLNGVKVIEQKLDLQTDNSKQVVVYGIPSLKKGDKLIVGASCNKGGDLSKEVKVE